MKRIGLIVAMPEETEHILDKLGKEVKKETANGYEVTEYKVDKKHFFLINSGVGEINSAASCMLLIERYRVEAIINFGVAGALKKGIKVGDIMIAKDIVHYDFDISAFLSLPVGAYPDEDSYAISCDPFLIGLADSSVGDKIKRVRIASGDKFVSSTELKNKLISDFDADICEMESAGIVRVANKAKVPSLIIKTVSDEADEDAVSAISDTIEKGVSAYVHLIESLIRII